MSKLTTQMKEMLIDCREAIEADMDNIEAIVFDKDFDDNGQYSVLHPEDVMILPHEITQLYKELDKPKRYEVKENVMSIWIHDNVEGRSAIIYSKALPNALAMAQGMADELNNSK